MIKNNVLDLTQTITNKTLTHKYDDPIELKKIREIAKDYYSDYKLITGMHVGTHIDAPAHLIEEGKTLLDFNINIFMGKAILIDARNKIINKKLLENIELTKYKIVLVYTGQSEKWGKESYFENYPVIEPDFAEVLINYKINILGIDSFSPDNYPFKIHKLLFQNNILIIENLTNFDKLRGVKDFSVIALPLKIEADSAPARVVAIY